MLRNLSKKLGEKFPLVRIPCVNGALSGILELEAIQVDGQQVQQKDVNRRKSQKGKN